jgi:hypothetical protein
MLKGLLDLLSNLIESVIGLATGGGQDITMSAC